MKNVKMFHVLLRLLDDFYNTKFKNFENKINQILIFFK